MGKKRKREYVLRYNGKQLRPQVRELFDSYTIEEV